jgi:hypothetical protein
MRGKASDRNKDLELYEALIQSAVEPVEPAHSKGGANTN